MLRRRRHTAYRFCSQPLAGSAAAALATRQRLEVLRVATETRHKLELVYLDLQRRATERTVCPHGYVFCGQVWTLAVWCDTREAFRSFGVDRIRQVDLLPNRYSDELGRKLADLLRKVQGLGEFGGNVDLWDCWNRQKAVELRQRLLPGHL